MQYCLENHHWRQLTWGQPVLKIIALFTLPKAASRRETNRRYRFSYVEVLIELKRLRQRDLRWSPETRVIQWERSFKRAQLRHLLFRDFYMVSSFNKSLPTTPRPKTKYNTLTNMRRDFLQDHNMYLRPISRRISPDKLEMIGGAHVITAPPRATQT